MSEHRNRECQGCAPAQIDVLPPDKSLHLIAAELQRSNQLKIEELKLRQAEISLLEKSISHALAQTGSGSAQLELMRLFRETFSPIFQALIGEGLVRPAEITAEAGPLGKTTVVHTERSGAAVTQEVDGSEDRIEE